MTWDDEGLDPEDTPEDRREFRRMMDALGREGVGRMIEQLTGEIGANPQDTGRLYTRGLLYNELGEHRLAEEDYGRIIALDPANANAHQGRAHARSEMGEYRLAEEDYDAAIRLAPGNAVAHYSRGACQAQLGNLAGAVSDFDVAICCPRRMPTPGTTGD